MPFALFGDDLAPYLWIWVARAGGLFGCVMAYRLASRLIGGGLYGVLAGISAFLALFASNKYVRDAALGNSEPLLAAVFCGASSATSTDAATTRSTSAWRLLLRPRCGLPRPVRAWLWFAEPRLRLRMVAFAGLIPALWFLPEWWGAGDPFRAGSRANAPNPGSAASRSSPRSRC